jgi:hypothetical protein
MLPNKACSPTRRAATVLEVKAVAVFIQLGKRNY